MTTVKKLTNYLLLAAMCCVVLPASTAFAQKSTHDEFDPTQFGWSATPAKVEATLETSLDADHFGPYTRLTRRVKLHSEHWRQFFVFYHDKLIAQGYARREHLVKPRVGTISDVVSYNNHFWMVRAVTKAHGKPAFSDARSRRDFSQELGNDKLRARRSLAWDLDGERFRWELKDGTIRYTVQYSMDGLAEHRLVNVNPARWANYFEFETAQAFRDAGIQLIRRFRRRTKKWVVASFAPSGALTVEKYNPPHSAAPRSARRTQWSTDRCHLAGKHCKITYHYYGGHLYQVDVDFSQDGRFPREGHQDKIARKFYDQFVRVDNDLRRYLGNPGDSKHIKHVHDGRERMHASNLLLGQQAFWSVWYDVGNDILVRHTISADNEGAGFHVDHRVTFRFHSVARALAEHDAWKVESAKEK